MLKKGMPATYVKPSMRSFHGLSVPVGTTLVFADDDPISVTAGNEAKLPVFVLVKGAATIEGSVYLAGDDADDASADNTAARAGSTGHAPNPRKP
jgi:hypothetical protein